MFFVGFALAFFRGAGADASGISPLMSLLPIERSTIYLAAFCASLAEFAFFSIAANV
jgi:hypothetical protein